MQAAPHQPYSRGQVVWAIVLAGLVGWAVLVAYNLALVWPGSFEQAFTRERLASQKSAFLVIGLPMALITSGLVMTWPMIVLMRRPVTPSRAFKWGFGLSLGTALLSIAIGRLLGLMQYLDQDSSSRIGGGDYLRSVDGILTAYGWHLVGRNTLVLVVGCTLGAILIQRIIGPGRRQTP